MNEINLDSLCGILVVDKPLQWSSMDVIRRIRQSTGQRKLKAGHAGTLDPLATGVLVCCIGKATKLVEKLMGQPKVYEAQVDLTAFTTTDDREGERQEVMVTQPPTAEQVGQALALFVGEIQQRPPAFSAIHIEGRRAYDLARSGQQVEIPLRTVTVYDAQLMSYDWPVATVRIHCGKGTYIRSIARDLGLALQTGGHLASLRRTKVGQFEVAQAMSGELLREKRITQEDLIPLQAVEGLEA
jgi:tRNA pseudouridine55 synthase